MSPEESHGTELLLEPNSNLAAAECQNALYEAGIPKTYFAVDDIQKEFQRLSALGVKLTVEPVEMGGSMVAVFDDTCGKLIQIYQDS